MLNLQGPSTNPGAPQITPQAINDGVNAELALKADIGSGSGNYVDVTTPTYVAATTDGFIAVNSVVPVTITLATNPPLGARQTVHDIAGHAAAAHITVQPPSGTISGFANAILTQNRQAQAFTFTSIGWVLS